jgi:hypothetical protein
VDEVMAREALGTAVGSGIAAASAKREKAAGFEISISDIGRAKGTHIAVGQRFAFALGDPPFSSTCPNCRVKPHEKGDAHVC